MDNNDFVCPRCHHTVGIARMTHTPGFALKRYGMWICRDCKNDLRFNDELNKEHGIIID